MAFGDLVQTAKGTGNEATSAAGVTATFASTPVPGNLITVHAYGLVASITLTTDLASASALASAASDAGGILDGFYKIAGSSEATAIKVFPSSTSDLSVIICEWEGPFASSPLDVESAGTSSGTTATTSQSTGTTGTTAQPDELAVGAIGCALHNNAIGSWTNSFTEANEQLGPASNNRATMAVAYKVLTATGTQETTASFGSARSKGMIATFKRLLTPVEGDIAATLADITGALAGSTLGGSVGTLAATLADVTGALSGTVVNPSWPGGLPQAAVIAIYDARELAGSASDPVAAWPDSGPLAQDDLVQGTSANRPVISDSGFDGVRSVQFDGTNDRLDVTLGLTYSDDFALILVCELLTYPTGTAGVFYSTGAIPNKNILGIDDNEDPPGWVTMSSNDGTQAQHHHGTADWAYVEDVPSRFIMTQLVRNDGEHKLWENAALVIDLADSSGENSDLNNMPGIKLGAREDNSRFVNGRIAYLLLVDMTETDEATLLDARDELANEFNVPGFQDITGNIASTLADITGALAGSARQIESGGSTAGVDVVATGGAIGNHLGGSEADITVVDSGAGQKGARGGTEGLLVVTGEGGGTKTALGGTDATVLVNAEGAGGELDPPAGGSTAFVDVDAEGAGRKAAQGGSTSGVDATAQAGGRKTARGSSEADVVVSAEGAGTAAPSGGSTAGVLVNAQGGGHISAAAGGSIAGVLVGAQGFGVGAGNLWWVYDPVPHELLD